MSIKIKITKKKNIFNFSSPQELTLDKITSNNNNFSSNEFLSFLKGSIKNDSYKPNSKISKSINNSNKNDSYHFGAKIFELESRKKEEEKNEDFNDNKSTTKIDYRHYKYFPITDIFPIQQFENYKEELYWLVTYDKLIKSKKIIKILNHNNIFSQNNFNSKPIYTESSLKVKTMKIPQYEIFFVKGYDKPFVKPNRNSFILAKLYLLTIKEINKIINFINRTNDIINIDKYISKTQKDLYQLIDINNNSDINNDINIPYCYIYYLGKFMNNGMYLFTNSFNYIHKFSLNTNIIYSLPSSKKLYKLIKIFIKTFPEYNPELIINNIIKSELYTNSRERKYEIMKYFSLLRPSVPNKLLLNKVLRDTITGIQTNTSISVSSHPFDSGEQIRTSEELKNTKNKSLLKQSSNNIKKTIPKGNRYEFKSSLNSLNNYFLNGQQYATTYLSTNHTIQPNNSIRTYSNKNTISNNIPLITIPDSLTDNIKRDTYNSNYCLINKNKNKGKIAKPKRNIELKKINIKNVMKNKSKNNSDKENININSILNKKKDFNLHSNKQIIRENINNDGINKIKKNEKKRGIKEEGKNEYHTPKKKRKLRYYK